MSTPSPREHLRFHWRQLRCQCRRQWQAAFDGRQHRDQLLMTIGAIRCLYWQALGLNQPHIAGHIAKWWAITAPLHRMGALIA